MVSGIPRAFPIGFASGIIILPRLVGLVIELMRWQTVQSIVTLKQQEAAS